MNTSATTSQADKPARPDWLSGVIPPVITPFTESGAVDHEALARIVEQQITAGVSALFVLGSSAETAYLSDSDREDIAGTVATASNGRVPVLVGCIDTTSSRVIHQVRMAERAGADGVVGCGPFYAINDTGEVLEHFRSIRAATDLPLIAYDVPVRTHVKLAADTLITLASEGTIAGVKDSSGDDVGFRRLVAANRAAGSPLAVLTGHEVVCDAMALIGADGFVPGLGNVDPDGYVRLWNFTQKGDWDAARAEQERLAALFEIAFVPTGRSADARGIGAFKTAMAHLGTLPGAWMAPPVERLSDADARAVISIVDRWRVGADR